MEKFRKNLLAIITARKIKRSWLAKEVGLTSDAMLKIIKGDVKSPKLETVVKIARTLDVPLNELAGEADGQPAETSLVPVINWKDIDAFLNNQTVEHITMLPIAEKNSDNMFALVIKDTVMEPMFLKNSFVIFNTKAKTSDLSYVMVKLEKNGEYIFRQLIENSPTQKFFRVLNVEAQKNCISPMNKGDQIVGKLVETRNNFKALTT